MKSLQAFLKRKMLRSRIIDVPCASARPDSKLLYNKYVSEHNPKLCSVSTLLCSIFDGTKRLMITQLPTSTCHM
jgi:hypothetical protein